MAEVIRLLESKDEDGAGDAQIFDMGQGDTQVVCWGTWDGATAVLEFSPDNEATWIAATDTAGNPVTFTADGSRLYKESYGQFIRGSLSDSGETTSINMKIQSIRGGR